MEDFSKVIKQERQRKNWSIGKLSKISGIPISTIHNYEKGVRPTLEKADILLKALEMSLKIGANK